jgi:hypothetical protein
MRQKSFIIAIFVTLFIIGTVAGVARAAYIAQQPADNLTQLKQDLVARDAQYAQTITEANTRLMQANEALQKMQQQLDAQQAYIAQLGAQPVVQAVAPASASQNAAAAASAPQAAISTDQASQIALTAANNWAALAGSKPDMVDYQGKAAYEVKLDNGGSMYIDSQDGSLLFNSLTDSSKSVITEDEASKAAVTYLKGGGVFKVQRSVYNGQPAYKVIFDVGHRIYVSLGGNILDVELYTIVASGGGGGSAPSAPASSHHEDGGGGGDD